MCVYTYSTSYDTYKLWYIYDPVVLWYFLPFASSLLWVVDGPGCFLSFSSISSSPGRTLLFLFSSFFRMKAKSQTDEYKNYQPAQQQRKRGQSEIPWCQTAFHPSGNPPWNHPLVCKEPFGSQEFGSQDFTILSFFFFFFEPEQSIILVKYSIDYSGE